MIGLLLDKDAIRDVLHQYCFCMDHGRFTELAALFVSDGEWIAPYRRAKGPSEIAAWLAQSVPSKPRRMHYTMNSIITVDSTRAEARSNYLVVVEGAHGPVPSVCGTYQDALAKVGEAWRFQRRELIHAFHGDMALSLPHPRTPERS